MSNVRQIIGKALELTGTGLVFVSAFLPWLSIRVWGTSISFSLLGAAQEAGSPMLSVAVYGLLVLCVANAALKFVPRTFWTSFILAAATILGFIFIISQNGMRFSYLGIGAMLAVFVGVPLLIVGAILSAKRARPANGKAGDDEAPMPSSGRHVIRRAATGADVAHVAPATGADVAYVAPATGADVPHAAPAAAPQMAKAAIQPNEADAIDDDLDGDDTRKSRRVVWIVLAAVGVAVLATVLFFVLRKGGDETEGEAEWAEERVLFDDEDEDSWYGDVDVDYEPVEIIEDEDEVYEDGDLADAMERAAQSYGEMAEDDVPIGTIDFEEEAENIAVVQKQESSTDSGDERVYDIVEQMPSFPGGDAELMKYISNHIKYPTIAEENGISGRVVCTFVVERDGSISGVTVLKSVDPSLDKEAVRVVKSMPKWIPGKQNGAAVRTKYTIPVTFRLQ